MHFHMAAVCILSAVKYYAVHADTLDHSRFMVNVTVRLV